MDMLSDSVFKKMFHVDRPTFSELLDLISPVMIERDLQKARNSSGTPIHPKTHLAVALRWLAGGSHIDLCFAWGIGYSTFYSDQGVLWPTIEAIDAVFHIGFPMDDVEKLQQLSQRFYEQSNGLFDCLVIVMDGIAIQTRAPFVHEVSKRKDYRFQKGGFAIIALEDAMLMLGSFQQPQTTATVPMTLWHGTIVNYAKQLSMIRIYHQSIFSLVMRLLQIIINS
jgi:hypothetical protein